MQGMAEDFDKEIAAGLAALQHLKRTTRINFRRWLVIGQGLEAGKQKLGRALHPNGLESQLGKKAFGEWLRKSGYDVISSPTRVYLARIVANRAAVESWYKGLPDPKKLRFNSPATIWTRFESQNKLPRARAEKLELSDRISAAAALILKISETHDLTVTNLIGLIRSEISAKRMTPMMPRRAA